MSTDIDTDEHSTKGRGGRDGRTVRQRTLPFLGLAAAALVALPILETISWGVGQLDPPSGVLIQWAWVITGLLLALIAAGIGLRVSRRMPFVVWHVIVTCVLVGVSAGITTDIGWAYSRFWTVLHVFGNLLIAASWALYRIDALRAAATGKSGDAWGAVIGLAKSRPRKVTFDEAHVFVEVEHGPGDTTDTVAAAAKKLESNAGAIKGRTTVTGGERADTSLITMTMADPFADWRNWPGLSHPGRSFAFPLRTAYYSTGSSQWFSFVASLRSPLTSFRSEGATFVGAVGTTGAGKSGFLTNVAAETLSRSDAVVVWVDADKLMQNAGWCMDMLAMAAKDKAGVRSVTKALVKLAEFRVTKFGQALLDAIVDPEAPPIGREWTPQLAQELGEPAVLVIADEADTYMDGDDWKRLATKGRSLGIFLLPATPRASNAEVPALIRGSVATWKTFGIGDNYSGTFSMSQETQDAGADPSKFRAPGMHYLDKAPGVDVRMYAVAAREFKSDPAALRRELEAVRKAHPPMTLSAESVAYMGEHFQKCRPDVVMGIRPPVAADDDRDGQEAGFDAERTQRMPAQPVPFIPPADDDDLNDKEEPVMFSSEGTSLDSDSVAAVDHAAIDPDLARELRGVDPHAPIDTTPRPDPIFFNAPSGKPKWGADETEAELDRVLIQFHREGRDDWGNQDVMDAMRCEFAATTVSRRLDALTTGARIAPPGIVVERLGRGRFTTVRTTEDPRP